MKNTHQGSIAIMMVLEDFMKIIRLIRVLKFLIKWLTKGDHQ